MLLLFSFEVTFHCYNYENKKGEGVKGENLVHEDSLQFTKYMKKRI
jgi:hypothetical protein